MSWSPSWGRRWCFFSSEHKPLPPKGHRQGRRWWRLVKLRSMNDRLRSAETFSFATFLAGKSSSKGKERSLYEMDRRVGGPAPAKALQPDDPSLSSEKRGGIEATPPKLPKIPQNPPQSPRKAPAKPPKAPQSPPEAHNLRGKGGCSPWRRRYESSRKSSHGPGGSNRFFFFFRTRTSRGHFKGILV